MAIYAISDLHLSLSTNKPMDVFGSGWTDYVERLKSEWQRIVTQEDTIILPGDISWAMYIEETEKDFGFIEELPGKKLISKGNHDYWWTTMNKMEKYVESREFKTISFLHNNSYSVGNTVLCGARGWKCPGDDGFSQEDRKIYNRELQRLELSLKNADSDKNIIAALHYPPFNSKKEPSEFVEIMQRYKVKTCIYGHLHGEGFKNAFCGEYKGINFYLVSADFLKFQPLKIAENG